MKKQLDEQRFQCAVRSLALCKAKYAVRAQILADGLKLSHFSCVELTQRRDQYFSANREELIASALVDIWKLRSFARYRPQPQTPPRSRPLE
jgi:hypothetical protein